MSALDNDDADDLEKLLQGDDFVTEEQQDEQAARERRLARKRRLEQIQAKPQPSAPEVHPPTSTPNGSANDVVKKEEEDEPTEVNQDENQDEDDEDDLDMFSNSVSPLGNDDEVAFSNKTRTNTSNQQSIRSRNVDTQQDWDDAEGYYKASIGKGVFSTVLKCITEGNGNSTAGSWSKRLPPQVALKCIRHNETMAKAAYNEIRYLQRFTTPNNGKQPSNKTTTTTETSQNEAASTQGIVPLLLPHNNVPLEFRGHTILVFPYMEYNLRDVLQKFGKGVGLSLTAVRSYFGQLLSAATHLKQHSLIHADLKPDNILVSQDFTTVQLCDFGSAVEGSSSESGGSMEPMVTPYLVSRFYRAPEIILGLVPTYAIDLWSLAVTVAELFLGKVLFQGRTNNDMIHLMMQQLGPVPNRVIRQHLVQTKRFPIKAHFQQVTAQYVFRQETVDPVSGRDVHKNVSLVARSTSSSSSSSSAYDYSSPKLQSKLLKAKSAKDSRGMVLQFSDLLQKCLTLDATRRIAVKMALHHEFFQQEHDQQQPSTQPQQQG